MLDRSICVGEDKEERRLSNVFDELQENVLEDIKGNLNKFKI